MMKTVKYFGCQFLFLMSGFIIGINVAYLKPNPNYEFGWHKVAMALIFGLMFMMLGYGIITERKKYEIH